MFKSHSFDKIFDINGKESILALVWYNDYINSHWHKIRKRLFNNNWNISCDYRRNSRNPKNNIHSKEQEKGFFSDYRKHSKDIGKVIDEGFGSGSELLGICRYVNGKLERKDPQVKSIEDIALAEDHLEKGYQKIWGVKERIEKQVVELHDNISQVIKQYEEIINSSISAKFKPVTKYEPMMLVTQSVYYQSSLYSCLFEEINKQFNNVPPSHSTRLHDSNHKIKKIINNNVEVVAEICFYVAPYFLMDGESADLEEFKNIFDGLRTNEQLVESVRNYNNLKLKLSEIDFKEFYDEVDKLSTDIRENRTTLEGNCKHCPKNGFLDYF